MVSEFIYSVLENGESGDRTEMIWGFSERLFAGLHLPEEWSCGNSKVLSIHQRIQQVSRFSGKVWQQVSRTGTGSHSDFRRTSYQEKTWKYKWHKVRTFQVSKHEPRLWALPIAVDVPTKIWATDPYKASDVITESGCSCVQSAARQPGTGERLTTVTACDVKISITVDWVLNLDEGQKHHDQDFLRSWDFSKLHLCLMKSDRNILKYFLPLRSQMKN